MSLVYNNRTGCYIYKKITTNVPTNVPSNVTPIDLTTPPANLTEAHQMILGSNNLVTHHSTNIKVKKPRIWLLTSAAEGVYWDEIERGFTDAIKILRSQIKEARFIRAGLGIADESSRIEKQKKILREIKAGKHRIDLLMVTCANINDSELVNLITDIIDLDNGIEVGTLDVYGFHHPKAITFFGPQPCEIGKKVASKVEELITIKSSTNILVITIYPGWGALEQKVKCIREYYKGKCNLDVLYIKDKTTTEQIILDKLNHRDYHVVINTTLSTIIHSVNAIRTFLSNRNINIINVSTDYTKLYLDDAKTIRIDDYIDDGSLEYANGWNQYYIGYTSVFHCLSKTLLYTNRLVDDLPFTIGNGDSSVAFNNQVEQTALLIHEFGGDSIATEEWWRNTTNYIEVESSTNVGIQNFNLQQEFNWVTEKKISRNAKYQGGCNSCVVASGLVLVEFLLRKLGNYTTEHYPEFLSLPFAIDRFTNNKGDICRGNNFIDDKIGEQLIAHHQKIPSHSNYNRDNTSIQTPHNNYNNYIDLDTQFQTKYRCVKPVITDLNETTIKYAAEQFIKLLSYGPIVFIIRSPNFDALTGYPSTSNQIGNKKVLKDNSGISDSTRPYYSVINVEVKLNGYTSNPPNIFKSNDIIPHNTLNIKVIQSSYTWTRLNYNYTYNYNLTISHSEDTLHQIKINNTITAPATYDNIVCKITEIVLEPTSNISTIDSVGHMMTGVGIINESGTPLMIVKNSWGNTFGVSELGDQYSSNMNKNGYCLINLYDLGNGFNGTFNIYQYGALQFNVGDDSLIDINIDPLLIHTINETDITYKSSNNVLLDVSSVDILSISRCKITLYNRTTQKTYNLLKDKSNIISNSINILITNDMINENINKKHTESPINIINTSANFDISIQLFGNSKNGPVSNLVTLNTIHADSIDFLHPNNYSNSLDVKWKIDTNRRVVLVFEQIEVESTYDHITLYNKDISDTNIVDIYNTSITGFKYNIIEDNNDHHTLVFHSDNSNNNKGFKVSILDVNHLKANNIHNKDVYVFGVNTPKYDSLSNVSNITNWVSLKSHIIDAELSTPTIQLNRDTIDTSKYNINIFNNGISYDMTNITNIKYVLTNNLNYNPSEYSSNISNISSNQSISVTTSLDSIFSSPNDTPPNRDVGLVGYNNIDNNSSNTPFRNIIDYKYKLQLSNHKHTTSYVNYETIKFYPQNLIVSYPNNTDKYKQGVEHHWELKFYGKVYIHGHYNIEQTDLTKITHNNTSKSLVGNNNYYVDSYGTDGTETIIKIRFNSATNSNTNNGFYFTFSSNKNIYNKYKKHSDCMSCGSGDMMTNNKVYCSDNNACINYNGPNTKCANNSDKWTRNCDSLKNASDGIDNVIDNVIDKFIPISTTCISDACGVCDGDGSSCAGCNGVANSGLVNDACGVCGEDGSSCAGCDGVPNSGVVNDACGVCNGDNSSCLGCDGVANSGLVNDACGVCNGNNSCLGCDGIANSGKVNDVCGVCGGDGSSCAGCDGVANSGLVNDACNVCGGNGSSCAGCDGVANSGLVNDACGECGGDNSSCNSEPLCATAKSGENHNIGYTNVTHIHAIHYSTLEEITCRLNKIGGIINNNLHENLRILKDGGVYKPTGEWVNVSLLYSMITDLENTSRKSWDPFYTNYYSWSWAFTKL